MVAVASAESLPVGAFGEDLPAEVEALDWAAMGLCLAEFPDFVPDPDAAAPPPLKTDKQAASEGACFSPSSSGAAIAGAEGEGTFDAFLVSFLGGEDNPGVCDMPEATGEDAKGGGDARSQERAPRAGSPSSGESTLSKEEARKIRNRESAATSRERQKARAAAEKARLGTLEVENEALRQQLERALWENEELRRALASRTSGAGERKDSQKPVESAELKNGNLLPMGSQPVAPFPSRSAPFPCGPTSSPLAVRSLMSRSHAGRARGLGKRPAAAAPASRSRSSSLMHGLRLDCLKNMPPPPPTPRLLSWETCAPPVSGTSKKPG